jgi:hypothetical protein
VPDGARALMQVTGSPFDVAGRRPTHRIRMACKRSGVRIPIAPLSQVFPGQSIADGDSRICGQDSRELDRGSGRGICAGHSGFELIGPSLAYPASEPDRAVLLASRVLAVQARFCGWVRADFALSDLRWEPRWEHAAVREEAPRAVMSNSPGAGQEAFGRSGRWPGCDGCRTSGTCLPWRACDVAARLSLGRSCRRLLAAQIVPGTATGHPPSSQ